MDDSRRAYVRELQEIECRLMRKATLESTWLSKDDENTLRWALSFARVSVVVVKPEEGTPEEVNLGHATDGYRTRLFRLLKHAVASNKIRVDEIKRQINAIHALLKSELKEVLTLFGDRLPKASLYRAIQKRPLALTLGGGGGTAYVFLGAMQLLDEANIEPALISGTSMGAILGAFRCKERAYSIASSKELLSRLRWRNVFRLFDSGSRFGMPATLKLHLREVLGHEFEKEGGDFMRLRDLAIPLRVCVAGLTRGAQEKDLERYAHLLDDVGDARGIRVRATQIARTLGEITREPVRGIYLGGDELTQEFDVLDAIGFSSAVPGVVHYDILRDDPRMIELCETLRKREGVARFIDGGLADNLPAQEAWRAVQSGAGNGDERDPFVLALDGFAPQLSTRHLLFLPLMRIAAENSKVGKESAHTTITFKRVLSPLTLVPSSDEFVRAVKNGRREMQPHMAFVSKMVGAIPPPPQILEG